jgi:hypothetical protein
VTPDAILNTPTPAFEIVDTNDCVFTTGTVATGIRSYDCTYTYEVAAPSHTTNG